MNPDRSSLHRVVDQYKTDKTINGYTDLYYCLFQPYRHEVKNILEIGIGTVICGAPSTMYGQDMYDLPGYRPGASLRTFRDWFPNATVYGIDIQPDTQFTEDRIVTMLGDSTDKSQVDRCMEEKGITPGFFDIIIDDGLHTQAANLATITNFFPYLKSNGLYVIEDVDGKTELLQNPEQFNHIWGNKPCFVYRRPTWGVVVIRNAD